MELLEIRSGRDLTALEPEATPVAMHSYRISCRQFMSVLGDKRRSDPKSSATSPGSARGFMTLSADRIWMTEAEISQVVGAIQSAQSPVSLT